jgi:hypothetical protein
MLTLHQMLEPLTGGVGMLGLTIQKALMASIKLMKVADTSAAVRRLRVVC